MTSTTTTRPVIRTKAELKVWLASVGIALAAAPRQKDGALHFVPVLPPRLAGLSTTYRATIGSAGLDASGSEHGYSHDGTRWVSGVGTHVPLTDDEHVVADAYIARLREIDELVRAQVRNVYISLG